MTGRTFEPPTAAAETIVDRRGARIAALLLLLLVAPVTAFGQPGDGEDAVPMGPPAVMSRPSWIERLIPRRLLIPDGFAIDVTRDPPRFAAPVDEDTVVGLQLFARPESGLSAHLLYQEEDRTLGSDGDLIQLRIEFRF